MYSKRTSFTGFRYLNENDEALSPREKARYSADIKLIMKLRKIKDATPREIANWKKQELRDKRKVEEEKRKAEEERIRNATEKECILYW